MAGKGSVRRPTCQVKFGENYDRIFGDKDPQVEMDFRPSISTRLKK